MKYEINISDVQKIDELLFEANIGRKTSDFILRILTRVALPERKPEDVPNPVN